MFCALVIYTVVYLQGILGADFGNAQGSRSSHKEKDVSHHRHGGGRSSADDPAITPTRGDKIVSSNSRSHPRAEMKGGGAESSRRGGG